jgi:hypothetical protein
LRVAAIFAAAVVAVALRVPLCPIAIITHHPCPGCGLTRAALALMRGDVSAALHFHPLGPIVVPLIGAGLAYNVVRYLRTGSWWAAESLRTRWVTVIAGALFVALFGVWVARFFGAFGGPVAV